ncbi:MAG: 16S rRNA (adenine(1518)-N(6)/adenine(1519)-N(6))-dimethyltransferase RsmA [Cytophagales bacterium]
MYQRLHLKKSLGQHFLRDDAIAQKIANCLQHLGRTTIEIGPGDGALTHWMLPKRNGQVYLVEVDERLVGQLKKAYEGPDVHVVHADVLTWPLSSLPAPLSIIGNLPYNISSRIFFKIFAHQHLVEEVVCMVQHEVAARIASPPGSRVYGILSVLLQAFYKVEYLFTVPPTAFEPPPKVMSGVVRLTHRHQPLPCDPLQLQKVVKVAFHQRRKKLRNALASFGVALDRFPPGLADKRAEQLSVPDFIHLTQVIYA